MAVAAATAAVVVEKAGTEIPGGLEGGEDIWIAGTMNGHPGKLPPIAGKERESGRVVGLGPGRGDLGWRLGGVLSRAGGELRVGLSRGRTMG